MWLTFLLRLFFSLLYHSLAWAYDAVAWVVSLGRWQDWGKTALPYLYGRTLEVGCGPGHLQAEMAARGWSAVGLDESRQMIAQAARRLRRCGWPLRLARARAQALPYPALTFDTVVATFPSEYILETETLQEIERVLKPEGKLVVVAMVWFTGRRCVHRWLRWLFRVTGESQEIDRLWPFLAARLEAHGFAGHYEFVEMDICRVVVILAEKRPSPALPSVREAGKREGGAKRLYLQPPQGATPRKRGYQ